MSKFLNIFGPASGGTAVVLLGAYFLADQFVADVPAPMRGQVVAPAVAAEEDTPAPSATPEEAPAATVGDTETPSLPASVQLALGRPATEAEIAAWDIDVRPDGQGLPPGSGDVFTGEEVFAERCAVCHGDFGEAVGRWPVLAGGQDTLTDERPVKTIGSYWPYLSTVWDYVHRAMPFGDAQSLSDDDVYAITAYLLYLNDLVDEDFELSHENFNEIRLPNEENFYPDNRTELEYAVFTGTPCMEGCKASVEVSMRAAVLDVTPEETKARQLREAVNAAKQGIAPERPAKETPSEDLAAGVTDESAEPAAVESAGDSPELIAAGEKAFRKCKACHQVGEGAKNRSGPQLNGVVGRAAGAVEGFKYSKALVKAAEEGLVWGDDALNGFLKKPRAYLKGTKMSFAGFKSEDDIAAVIAYLRSFAE